VSTKNSEQPDSLAANRPRQFRRRLGRVARWIEHLITGAVALLVLVWASPLPPRVFRALDCQAPLQPARFIICLGGDPSRVIEATRLLNEGYGERLILSNNPGGAAMMRMLAVEWGASPGQILIDEHSYRTADHPGSIQRHCGVDPAQDTCIVVTSYAHLLRSKLCFEKAGYRHICMREPRWERQFRVYRSSLKNNYRILTELFYELPALLEYRLRGHI